jgi:hypothetical protein
MTPSIRAAAFVWLALIVLTGSWLVTVALIYHALFRAEVEGGFQIVRLVGVELALFVGGIGVGVAYGIHRLGRSRQTIYPAAGYRDRLARWYGTSLLTFGLVSVAPLLVGVTALAHYAYYSVLALLHPGVQEGVFAVLSIVTVLFLILLIFAGAMILSGRAILRD